MTSQQDKTKKTWLLKLSSEKSHKILFELFKLETCCLSYLRATISQNNLDFIIWKSLSIKAFVENLTVLAQLSIKRLQLWNVSYCLKDLEKQGDIRNSLVLLGVTPLWHVAQRVSPASPHHTLPAFLNLTDTIFFGDALNFMFVINFK